MVHRALLTAVSKLHMEIRQHLSTQDPKPKIVSHGHDDWLWLQTLLQCWYPGYSKAPSSLALLYISSLWQEIAAVCWTWDQTWFKSPLNLIYDCSSVKGSFPYFHTESKLRFTRRVGLFLVLDGVFLMAQNNKTNRSFKFFAMGGAVDTAGCGTPPSLENTANLVKTSMARSEHLAKHR